MQLRGFQTGLVHQVDDPRRVLVSKDTNGEDLGWQPTTDVVGALHRDLTRRRRKHESHRVGTHGDGKQRIVLACDPADLDEHQTRRYYATNRALRDAHVSRAVTRLSPTKTAW